MVMETKLENLIYKFFYFLSQGMIYFVAFLYIIAIGVLLVMHDLLESKNIFKKIFVAILIGVFFIIIFSVVYSGMELSWVL